MKLYNGKWNDVFDENSESYIEGLNQFDRLVFHTQLYLQDNEWDIDINSAVDIANYMRKKGSYDHAFVRRIKCSIEKLNELELNIGDEPMGFVYVPKSYCYGIKDQGSDSKLKIMFAVARLVDFFKRCKYHEKKISCPTLWFKENWANLQTSWQHPCRTKIRSLENFTRQYLDELQKKYNYTYSLEGKGWLITFKFQK